IASSTGVITRCTRSERPAAIPTGTPIASESATEANVSANVRMLASQTPRAANETNAAAVPSAARRPPKRRTTAVPSTVVPTHVSLKKKLVSQPTMSSRKVAAAARRRGGAPQPRRWPSLALAGDGGEDGLAVDDPDHAVAVDGADRPLARGDHRDCGPHGGGDIEPGAVELAGRGVTHDPAQREHVAARDVAREVRDVVVRRRADEVLRRAQLDDGPVAHDRDPVAEPQRLRQVVRDEDHRLARLVLQADHLVLHVAADERVERAEGLVVEHHLRVDGERAGKTDALLHPAGELVGELVRAVLEPDELQHLLGARVPLRL